ncbi:MAG: glycosyltransferase family 4 protein [Candidatus Marsarchaeota archaeon]|jgi:glycosyltransferase involved in cell wall biosynthesis|nr:glycosyltransferase family 4 protein [Candidatus Marsarchaeota archaeon]
MKLLIISQTKPYKGSGTGLTEYAYQLEMHIKALLGRRDSIKELYALDQSKRNNISGLVYANTGFKKKIAAVPKDKYDIIHITDHEIGFVAKILKKSGNKAKIVTTIHDLSRFEEGLHKGLIQKAYNKLVQRNIKDAIKYSDFILCNSSQTYNTIIERFGKRKNMKVVLHGTNDSIIRAKLRVRHKGEIFTVGYMGALMKHKNVMFILEAAKLLKNNQYKFVIYGTGVDKNVLKAFKNRYNLSNVDFMGYLDENKKVEAYDSFDAFVFPSLYEGLGYPILEAQARGLPVIIYKHGKIPNEVRKYCFEAESPEHMAQIIEDLKENGYNEKQRKKATEYARSFTWNRCARETLSTYKSLSKNK